MQNGLVAVTRTGICVVTSAPKPKIMSRNDNKTAAPAGGAQGRARAAQTQLLLGSGWFSLEIQSPQKALFIQQERNFQVDPPALRATGDTEQAATSRRTQGCFCLEWDRSPRKAKDFLKSNLAPSKQLN